MSYLIVGSEHDMEVQIKYVTELAHNNSKSKIDITFPSYLFAEMFMDTTLNELQTQHIAGDIDLYSPIEAYYEEYDKNGKAIPGTRVRKDLPSIAQQWKMDCQRRLTNG